MKLNKITCVAGKVYFFDIIPQICKSMGFIDKNKKWGQVISWLISYRNKNQPAPFPSSLCQTDSRILLHKKRSLRSQ